MWRLIEGDCLEVLPTLEAESVNLIFADPPYNIGKAAWDKIPDYLQWCERWIAACSRVLKRNGAFWVSHSDPRILTDLSRLIEQHGRGLVNWVTWDKYNGATSGKGFLDGFTVTSVIRSYQPMVEYLIYHADEGDWTAQSDQTRGFIFEPLRAYLDGERRRAGYSIGAIRDALGFTGNMPYHWFAVGMAKGRMSQWQLPTPEHYAAMRHLFGEGYLPRDYTDLLREFEELRQSIEHLRYTFNNPGKVSSVWQFDPAPRNGHPTPKPEPLLERIITTCTNAGDTVLDPFAGSGTTLVVAERLGRPAIGIEVDAGYCGLIRKRLTRPSNIFALEAASS